MTDDIVILNVGKWKQISYTNSINQLKRLLKYIIMNQICAQMIRQCSDSKYFKKGNNPIGPMLYLDDSGDYEKFYLLFRTLRQEAKQRGLTENKMELDLINSEIEESKLNITGDRVSELIIKAQQIAGSIWPEPKE